MSVFEPTKKKIVAPLILLALSLISLLMPRFVLTALIFEPLAIPFGKALDNFRYQDKPFLTPLGTIIVGFIWSLVLYMVICLLGAIKKKSPPE